MSKNDHDDECNIERCTANQNFSIIPNEILQHPTMSSDAQMVLTYLLSCKDDWVIKPKNVWKAKNISRDHVYKAFDELIDLGYMLRIVTQVGNLKNSVKYKVSYFKKFLRHPESRDTEPRDTENQDGLIRNNEEKNHLEKESFDRIERSSEEKIYECLNEVALSKDEKIQLTRFCTDEERLKDAIALATADGFEAKNLAAVITSNYKAKRKGSKATKDATEQNKAFSARFVPLVRKHIADPRQTFIEPQNAYLRYTPGGNGSLEQCWEWEKVDFMEKIRKYFQSKNLWKKEMEELYIEFCY